MKTGTELEPLQRAASDLLVEWARLLAPHYGPSGSMDLDLQDWPRARGPSFYNQFAHYTFLLLATGEAPGCDAAERGRYHELALRNIEYALSITDAEFHTPHFSRGRDWGRHISEWLNYYLLCSLELMERHQLGSADLRKRLSEAVVGAVTELHRRFVAKYQVPPREFVGNHDTWHGLLFYRAGRHYHRAEWRDYARDFFARCVLPFQQADGYWPEGRGIVVGYSLVTAEAVSLYAELSGDDAAWASLGRFLGFYDFSSLPDGSTAVTLDVRMRYHRLPFLFLPPGFLGCKEGRELVLQRLRAARVYFKEAGVHDNGAQGFAFFGSFVEFVFNSGAQPREIRLQAPVTLPAARLVHGPWRAYLGWQIVPEHPSRFVLDTQNFVELWHRDAGYLAGTGGSKFMPRFSTVRRSNGGRAYIPDQARCLRADQNEAAVAYTFGADEVVVTVELGEQGCEVSAKVERAAGDAAYDFALILAPKRGEELVIDGVTEKLDPTVLLHTDGGPRTTRVLNWRNLTWQLPEGAVLDYPVVPHNSYTQDGLPAPDDYVGRISFPLNATEKIVTVA